MIPWRTPEQAFDGWRQASAGRPVDYTGLTYEKLRGPTGIPWPVNDQAPNGTDRLYTNPVFPTATDHCETYGHDLLTGGSVTEQEHRAMAPAGRAFLKGCPYTPSHEEPSVEYPLLFTTGRTVYQFHTRTKTRRSGSLNDAAPDAWVEINPDDAEKYGITEGDLVRVESPRGAIEVPARIGQVMVGAVFAPFHYGTFDLDHLDPHPAGGARQANELTMTIWDPVSKQPYFKTAACRISKTSADTPQGAEPEAAPGEEPDVRTSHATRHDPAMTHLSTYLELARQSEQSLADSLRTVADGHAHQPDIYHTCQTLATMSDDHVGDVVSGGRRACPGALKSSHPNGCITRH